MNAVVWFEIYVNDMDRACKFYETVLDSKLESLKSPVDDGEMYVFPADMKEHGASGALIKMDGFDAGANSTIVYFNCKDVAVEEARVAGAGGKVFQSKTSIGEHGDISLCVDTEGNMFGLHNM